MILVSKTRFFYINYIVHYLLENTTLIGGPFVSGEWSIFIPLGYYPLITPWLMQNRGNLSMLLHPNTGYEYEDHSIWAMWSGQPWPLDMSIFEQGTQTNEFDVCKYDFIVIVLV